MVKTFFPSALADFAVLYRTAGGTVPEVTRVGLLSAAMAGRDDAFAALPLRPVHSTRWYASVSPIVSPRKAGTTWQPSYELSR